ncbi:glycosyltransferase family 4 protein [Saxibacter everestensis]|uniref:Glycosyltransferase family 4 protein n=1 Tax=Saxibacter everestensis TaxID=2909229 RepID=A0ABY8QWR3_9MICO|nr:glycosyltransferase family 4 protein [Brevibacteriaceae bacterium ZFBP1038]
MRVAYVCVDPGIPVFGAKGGSVHVQEIIRAWRRRGAQVTVYCTRRGSAVPADLDDLDIVELPVRAESAGDRESETERRSVQLAGLIEAAGTDLVYERFSLFSRTLELTVGRLGIPAILEVNAPLIDEQARHRVLADRAAAERCLLGAARAASVVACVSAEVQSWLRGAVPEACTIVAPNGVNTERITPAVGGCAAGLTVGFVGTLKPWHGVHRLLDAAALTGRDWKLLIVGDGPMADDLRSQADTLRLDVEFTGAVMPEAMPSMLRRCDVAVAPYPPTESGTAHYFSPLKVYEYFAAGLPVVASAIGQLPKVIEHEVTGLLVDPRSVPELGQAIARLDDDPGLRRRLGAAAREAAVTRHNWDRVLEGILAAARTDRRPIEQGVR